MERHSRSCFHHTRMTRLMVNQLDHALTAAETATLEEHLAACPQCQSEWASLRQVDRFMRLDSGMVPSRRLVERLEDSMRTLPPVPARNGRFRRWLSILQPLISVPPVLLYLVLFHLLAHVGQNPLQLAVGLSRQIPVFAAVLRQSLQWNSLPLLSQLFRVPDSIPWLDVPLNPMLQTALVSYVGFMCVLGLAGMVLLNRLSWNGLHSLKRTL